MKDYVLAIDVGTQSVRALIFDLSGNLVERSRIPIQPYVTPKPGWAEQDPRYFWSKLCEACQSLWQISTVRPDAIAGIALTTQRSTVVNVDARGEPLRPAIIWLDQRRVETLEPVRGLWGQLFRVAGMTSTVAYLQAEAEANWIRTHEPQIWRNTYKYLLLSGYLTHQLTGEYVDSVGCQVGFLPFDYKALNWAKSWDWKWEAVPMSPDVLPRLVPPAGILGAITRQAAEATGLPEGLPVVAAAADKACEVIGSGAVQPNIGCLSYGTHATINTTHRKYVEVIPLIPPYPAAVPGYYSLEIGISRGFWMVSWFKEEFGHLERWLADELGIEPESLFDDLVNAAPTGSMGLILQPYWSPGIRYPGPEAKGAIIGFGGVHTRAHFYRAILEGLAYALRDGKERTERRSHIKVTELRVAGGGSQSDAAMQLTADVFGMQVARPHTYETSGLGAAIDAATGLGLHTSIVAAVAEMTRIGQVFDPDPKAREIYDGLYHRVYQRMYERLQPLYEEIRQITGYPSTPGGS